MSFDTLTDLWHGSCRAMLLAKRGEVHVASLTALRFDLKLRADSMDYEFDVSRELWMTKGRFTGLQRDYIDPPSLIEFIDKAAKTASKRPQIAQMLCRAKGQRHVSYKWGNCILAFTFRHAPTPVMTMHSRTSSITRMGGLDLALVYCIAQEIAAEADERVEDYGFVWHLGSMQHSSLQGVPYFCAHDWTNRKNNVFGPPGEAIDPEYYSDYPVLSSMIRQLDYFDRLDASGKVSRLGTRRRVREQRRAWMKEKLVRPAVPLDELNLDKIKEVA